MLENMLNWGRKIALAGAMTTASVMGYAETQEQKEVEYQAEPGIELGMNYILDYDGFRGKIGASLPLAERIKLGLLGQVYFETGDNEKVVNRHKHTYDTDEVCNDPAFADYDICKESPEPHLTSEEVDVTRTLGLGGLIGISYFIPFSRDNALEISAGAGLTVYFEDKHKRVDSYDPEGNIVRDLSGNENSTVYDNETNQNFSLNLEGCVGYDVGFFTIKGCGGYDFYKGPYFGGAVSVGLGRGENSSTNDNL